MIKTLMQILPPAAAAAAQVASDKLCQTGLEEEPELQWKADQAAALAPCQGIKHTFARIARECPDVKFFSLNVSAAATGLARLVYWICVTIGVAATRHSNHAQHCTATWPHVAHCCVFKLDLCISGGSGGKRTAQLMQAYTSTGLVYVSQACHSFTKTLLPAACLSPPVQADDPAAGSLLCPVA
jgi:hypothetical protein